MVIFQVLAKTKLTIWFGSGTLFYIHYDVLMCQNVLEFVGWKGENTLNVYLISIHVQTKLAVLLSNKESAQMKNI